MVPAEDAMLIEGHTVKEPVGPWINEILKAAVEGSASDVHFTVGSPPQMRIHGTWGPTEHPALSPADCEAVARDVLGERRMQQFLAEKECDCSFGRPGIGRFRANAFFQRGSIGLALRVLPYEIPGFEELGLPGETMRRLCGMRDGMVLICGPTGSGKSTTLAAMIGHINRTHRRHIVTIEDPIEFVHRHDQAIVDQREIGTDTESFAAAMKHVLRQAPDVLLVGEIRDGETMRTALMIAETGHLLLSTIHTAEVVQGLSRMVDMYPSDQQPEIRVSLSLVLRGMLVQQLLPAVTAGRRLLACELMLTNSAIANLIREGKFEQVYTQMQTRKGEGMRTMNDSLAALLRTGKLARETALAGSPNPRELLTLLESP